MLVQTHHFKQNSPANLGFVDKTNCPPETATPCCNEFNMLFFTSSISTFKHFQLQERCWEVSKKSCPWFPKRTPFFLEFQEVKRWKSGGRCRCFCWMYLVWHEGISEYQVGERIHDQLETSIQSQLHRNSYSPKVYQFAPEKLRKPNRKPDRLPVPPFFRGFHSLLKTSGGVWIIEVWWFPTISYVKTWFIIQLMPSLKPT